MPDEDGFITVTRGVKRGGRTANSDGTVHVKAGSAARALAAEAAATAAAKSQGLRDFYRFQTRCALPSFVLNSLFFPQRRGWL